MRTPVPLNASRLRALIVGSAELGELIMRAFILRRVGLLERGVGPILLGRAARPGSTAASPSTRRATF